MSWRDKQITEKQYSMIANMEEDAEMNGAFIPPFRGTTRGEASDYIDAYIFECHIAAYNPHEDAGDRQ